MVKIKRQECLDKYVSFPLSDNKKEIHSFPDVIDSWIIKFASKTTKAKIRLLCEAPYTIVDSMNYECLIFLGDFKRPWLYREDEYEPIQAKKAINYLKENKIDSRFDGGIQVDKAAIKEFIKHHYWLVRCNSALPIFNFMDEGQNILGNICHYGEIHLSSLNTQADREIKAILDKEGFTFVKENHVDIK
jgi:hypothetical protein